jgi:Tfp pilus assembly protein PilW
MKKINLFGKGIFHFSPNKSGFTIIELLLYIASLSVIILGVSVLLLELLNSKAKNQTIAKVEQQGLQTMQIITQTIRNSENINSPIPNISSASLSLQMVAAFKNPTIFDLSGSVIRITEGTGGAITLNSSGVVASSLSFQNLSKTNTSGIIRVQFTLTHLNPENKNEYDYTKTFIGSASLR